MGDRPQCGADRGRAEGGPPGDGRVAHLEALLDGVEGNRDVHLAIFLVDHRLTQHRRRQRGNALLPIDQDHLARGSAAVLQLHIGVTPRDQIADWKTLIKRVQQVAHLRSIPDEGALDFRDGDLALAHLGEDALDEVLVYGVFLGFHVVSLRFI